MLYNNCIQKRPLIYQNGVVAGLGVWKKFNALFRSWFNIYGVRKNMVNIHNYERTFERTIERIPESSEICLVKQKNIHVLTLLSQ